MRLPDSENQGNRNLWYGTPYHDGKRQWQILRAFTAYLQALESQECTNPATLHTLNTQKD